MSATEQSSTLNGLQEAVQMEIDGKAFYLKASKASTNPLGTKLLQRLAEEEDIHRQRFEKIYKAIQAKKRWPDVAFTPDAGKTLKTIFAAEASKRGPKGLKTELGAVQTAVKMEAKSIDLYKAGSKSATNAAEKEFYDAVTREEQYHHSTLLNYYEFLKDPGAWFVKAEHPSMDGGA